MSPVSSDYEVIYKITESKENRVLHAKEHDFSIHHAGDWIEERMMWIKIVHHLHHNISYPYQILAIATYIRLYLWWCAYYVGMY